MVRDVWTELYKWRVAHTESCDTLAFPRRSSGACAAVDALVLLDAFRCAVTTPHVARRGLRIGAVRIIRSSIIRLIVMLLEYTPVYGVERVAVIIAIRRVLLFSSRRLIVRRLQFLGDRQTSSCRKRSICSFVRPISGIATGSRPRDASLAMMSSSSSSLSCMKACSL